MSLAQKNGSASGRSISQPDHVRVAVASPFPAVTARIQDWLDGDSHIDCIATLSLELERQVAELNADVLILDLSEGETDFVQLAAVTAIVPVVALVQAESSAAIRKLLNVGIRGLLLPAAPGDAILSAVKSVVAGLAVMSPEFLEILLPKQEEDWSEADAPFENLTAREQDVLAMMAEGLLNKEIADRLKISEHTVKFHVSSIMGKLGAASRTEAVTRGIRRGLVIL